MKSGSPADKAGVQAGDIITMIEELPLATDGTMTDYCNIVRSHGPEDTLSVEVVRLTTDDVLRGQINGDELKVVSSFSPEFVTVTDDADAIQLEAPQDWDDVESFPWEMDGEVIGNILVVSPDIDGFINTYSTPGVLFGASPTLAAKYDPVQYLDEKVGILEDCTYAGRFPYEDDLYTGNYDLYGDCNGEENVILILAAMPADGSYLTFVMVQATTEAELETMFHILDTFYVQGDLAAAVLFKNIYDVIV